MQATNRRNHDRNRIVPWAIAVALAAGTVLVPVSSSAQWLNYPTPGIPRTPDGKPDLSAPVPRTADGKPDLTGLWRPNAGGYQINITADLAPTDVRPWALALTKQRAQRLYAESPTTLCLPFGPGVGAMAPFLWVKMIPTSRSIVMLYENRTSDREAFMDGRPLPLDPNPTWNGYSVGHWDGDTLVVESAGFNDKTWLDLVGHPHSEALRVTERFTRVDFGHVQLHMTIDDPQAYTRSFTVPVDLQLMPDTELLERVCNENERDVARTAGIKVSPITIPPSVLSTFVGTYDLDTGAAGGVLRVDIGRSFFVTLNGDELMLQRPGDKVRSVLTPVSETHFVHGSGADVEFISDAQGTHLVFQIAEGEARATRRNR